MSDQNLDNLRSSEVPTEDDLFELMRDVVDPELGINVVDLGLVIEVLEKVYLESGKFCLRA